MRQLEKILLIDDSEADNYLHKLTIESAGIAQSVVIVYDGREALDYLNSKPDGDYPCPELVFLDINMPGMDGWEFLEEYEKMDPEKKAGILICMLTTSVANKDLQKVKNFVEVSAYITKPLTEEKLMEMYHRIQA
ncbi:MAG: response regulator [Bacteroidota bacterium]